MAKNTPRAAAHATDDDAERDAATRSNKPSSENVHEFVLYRRQGEQRIPLMSDSDLDVVKSSKITAIADALREGRARPDLFIVDRDVTYPLSNGKRQATDSTCEEKEI